MDNAHPALPCDVALHDTSPAQAAEGSRGDAQGSQEGGIYGTICDVDDRTVLIKVDGEVKLRVDKNSISLDASASAPADGGKSEK